MAVTAKARASVEIRDLRIPLVLDRAHYNATSARPYYWTLREIGLDARGRMLAVVEVVLTEPGDNERFVPVEVKDRGTGNAKILFEKLVSVHFPMRTILFALVDVTSGTVPASTATAEVTLVSDQVETLTIVQKGVTDTVQQGPFADQEITLWEAASILDASVPDTLPPGAAPTLTASQTTIDGLRAFTINNWFKPEIRPHVYSHVTTAPLPPTTTPWVYAIVEAENLPPAYLAYAQTAQAYSQSGYVTHLRGAQRKRPGAAGEQLAALLPSHRDQPRGRRLPGLLEAGRRPDAGRGDAGAPHPVADRRFASSRWGDEPARPGDLRRHQPPRRPRPPDGSGVLR